MNDLLIAAKYNQKDIDLFNKSASEINEKIQFRPLLENVDTLIPVKLPTRSAMARSFLQFARKTDNPKVGDIVIFQRGNNGYSGHVGFVMEVGSSAIKVLGGNQSNEVNVSSYSKKDLLGYVTDEIVNQSESNFKSPNFQRLWSTVELDTEKEKTSYIKTVVDKMLLQKAEYQNVENLTGVPWWFTGAIHFREASQNMDKQILNGQNLNQVTTIVPKGLGPFKSFTEAAVIAYEKKDMMNKNFTFPQLMEKAERFNGTGYRSKGMYSPYVWSCTNHSLERGRYVADGLFDPQSEDKRPGVAAIAKYMIEKGYIS